MKTEEGEEEATKYEPSGGLKDETEEGDEEAKEEDEEVKEEDVEEDAEREGRKAKGLEPIEGSVELMAEAGTEEAEEKVEV